MSKKDDIYQTRATLLEKLRNKHDEESWKDFVSYYQGFIYVLCIRMNLNHHDAEDIVQKVLLASWNALPDFQYDNKKNFRGWLTQVSKNHIKNFYRGVKSQNNKAEKAANDVQLDWKNPEVMPDIEKIAEKEWNTYIASMAFDNIKGEFSNDIIDIFLKLSKGESNISVAKELDLPANTVAVYKKRVIAKLRKEVRRLNYELG